MTKRVGLEVNTLTIRIPIRLQRRGGRKLIMTPADLDIAPVENGRILEACGLWCAKGTRLHLELVADRRGWDPDATVSFSVLDPHGRQLAEAGPHHGTATVGATVQVALSGRHAVRVAGAGLPAAGAPFRLTATYTAPQTWAPAVP
jgi:hypothetical protein